MQRVGTKAAVVAGGALLLAASVVPWAGHGPYDRAAFRIAATALSLQGDTGRHAGRLPVLLYALPVGGALLWLVGLTARRRAAFVAGAVVAVASLAAAIAGAAALHTTSDNAGPGLALACIGALCALIGAAWAAKEIPL